MLRHLAHATLFSGFAVLAAASYACGSDDTRCATLCEVQDDTQGDVCSQASADACIDACNEQIGGVETACANCTLEGAELKPDVVAGGGGTPECKTDATSGCVSMSKCTITRDGQSCSYCEGSTMEQEACEKQLNPRREVECTVKFNDAANCSSQCG